MKITIEIDTELKMVYLKGKPGIEAVRYILEKGPRDLGKFYGKLLANANPSNKFEIIGHTPFEFSSYALQAFLDDDVSKTYQDKEDTE